MSSLSVFCWPTALLAGRARARGRHGGRPRKLQPKELKTIRALLKTTEASVQEIATRFGVSRSTLYRNWNLLSFGRVEKLVDSKMVATVKKEIHIV